jgi:hypothetical protein
MRYTIWVRVDNGPWEIVSQTNEGSQVRDLFLSGEFFDPKFSHIEVQELGVDGEPASDYYP